MTIGMLPWADNTVFRTGTSRVGLCVLPHKFSQLLQGWMTSWTGQLSTGDPSHFTVSQDPSHCNFYSFYSTIYKYKTPWKKVFQPVAFSIEFLGNWTVGGLSVSSALSTLIENNFVVSRVDNNLLNPKSQLLLQGEELIFTNYPFSSLLAVQICFKNEIEMIHK